MDEGAWLNRERCVESKSVTWNNSKTEPRDQAHDANKWEGNISRSKFIWVFLARALISKL